MAKDASKSAKSSKSTKSSKSSKSGKKVSKPTKVAKSAAKPADRPSPKRRLGRGLSSLIGSASASNVIDTRARSDNKAEYVSEGQPAGPGQATSDKTPMVTSAPSGQPMEVAIEAIRPNPYQPRREFGQQALAELAESISQQGILQPLVVSRDGQDDPDTPYVLIAGERRLRAARLAGRKSVPVVIKQANRQQMLEWALIENIHRADLNAVEKAEAYRDYIDRFELSQSAAAEKLGQPRTTISNYLRILDLCDDAQQLVAQELLSFGHAKVLAGLAGQAELQAMLAKKAAAENLSVRKLEQLVAAAQSPAKAQDITASPNQRAKPAYIRDMEEQFRSAIGTHVAINPSRKKHSGKIVIEYYSLDDFDRIAGAFGLAEA